MNCTFSCLSGVPFDFTAFHHHHNQTIRTSAFPGIMVMSTISYRRDQRECPIAQS